MAPSPDLSCLAVTRYHNGKGLESFIHAARLCVPIAEITEISTPPPLLLSYEIQNLFLASLNFKLNQGAGMTSFLQGRPIMTHVTQTQTLPCTVYTCISVKSRLRSSKQPAIYLFFRVATLSKMTLTNLQTYTCRKRRNPRSTLRVLITSLA